MLAQLTATVANFGFRTLKQPALPKHYMPSEWSRKDAPQKRKRRQTAAEMAEVWKGFLGDHRKLKGA